MIALNNDNISKKLRYYCTLFDKNYLIKGLAMYKSLEEYESNFLIYILCMDDVTYLILKKLNLNFAKLIPIKDFESEELLTVKPDRSVAEYCWTCAPCLPAYIFENNLDVDFITYLDSDLLFFSSLQPIYEEIKDASSVITEHRFAPKFMGSIVNGRYCVQWVSFRRDLNGLETLYWWKEKCIEWCYYKVEKDRMGDQKYLDCWTQIFKGVHELQHIGAGVAPWNFSNYRIANNINKSNTIYIDSYPLIFYHFHAFEYKVDSQCIPMPDVYLEDSIFPHCIYEKYESALSESLQTIRKISNEFNWGIEFKHSALKNSVTKKFIKKSLSSKWLQVLFKLKNM